MNQLNEIQRIKTIVLSEENHERLKRLGAMGESFNDVLSRVLSQVKEERSRNESEKYD